MTWDDNPDLTEPSDGDFRPTVGVTGGQMARPGDTYTVTFNGDGEEKVIEGDDRVEFRITLESASFEMRTTDGDAVEPGEDYELLTGSARFLSELAAHTPVGGKTLQVTVTGTGYDAAYEIEELEE
jgi:hypothetical protein